MTVRYSMDSGDVNNYLGRNVDGLDMDTIIALESALMTIFQATQAAVHVHSGRLRESGRTHSETTPDTWTGEIIYGGGSSGVDYAFWEQRRGGNHDFMKVAQGLDTTIGVAFRTGLD